MQLDLTPSLYHFIEDEAKAEKEWETLLRSLVFIKTNSVLCKRARGDYQYMDTLDDLIMQAVVCLYDMTDSQDNLSELVGKWQAVNIYTYNYIDIDKLAGYVARLAIPNLPHANNGIKIARTKVIMYLNKLKLIVNDL